MPSESIVHVIDDDPAMRDSLEFLFDTAGLPVRTYESAVAFLGESGESADGCVVTDVRMPEMTGIELLKELQARGSSLPVIVITGHGDVPLAIEAMKSGAKDFLEKPFDDARLLNVVNAALMEAGANRGEREEQSAVRERIAKLSQRERQVLRRLVEGQLNKTIAWELGISPRTVEVYRAKLMSKMGAPAFADLVRMALLAGDIDETADP